MKEVIEGLQTKEGLISLIIEMIKYNPNNEDLANIIKISFKNYFDEPQ